jgi:mannose-6-phosphate isomerase-like protein (cupin superfamily)
MKIGTDFILNGNTVKDNERYILTDNIYLKRNVVSSTLLHPKQSTRGHEHKGTEEVYIFIQGSGFMFLDEQQFPVRAGDVIAVEDGAFHRVTNPTDEPLYFICVFEGILREGKRTH